MCVKSARIPFKLKNEITMKNITAQTAVDKYNQPESPYKFATSIESAQDADYHDPQISILFNKGRYFETSVYGKDIIKELSDLTGIEVQYHNMFVASWRKLEDFVDACNACGYRCVINVDWI